MTARAANDVWAVGNTADGSKGAPLLQHWDGKIWTTAKAPALPWADVQLTAVTSVGDQVWAAGFAKKEFGNPVDGHPVMLRWDGKEWQNVKTPDMTSWIYGVAPDGQGGVIATGYSQGAEAVLLRAQGSTVTKEPTPVAGEATALAAGSAAGTKTSWIVGSIGTADGKESGLALHS